MIYRNDPEFSDKQVWASSADPDQSSLFVIPSATFADISLLTKADLLEF